MGKVRRKFDKEFKLSVVRELDAGKDSAAVSREHEIRQDLAWRWRREFRKNPKHAFAGKGVSSTAEARLAEMERLVGKLYAENEFLKKVCESLRSMLADAKEGG